MEVEDLIALAAHNLSIHVPQPARDRFFIILVRELLRENRKIAEKQGIGTESLPQLPELTDEMDSIRPLMTWQAFEDLREKWNAHK